MVHRSEVTPGDLLPSNTFKKVFTTEILKYLWVGIYFPYEHFEFFYYQIIRPQWLTEHTQDHFKDRGPTS